MKYAKNGQIRGGFHIQADVTTERLNWAFNPNSNQFPLIFKLMTFDTYPV